MSSEKWTRGDGDMMASLLHCKRTSEDEKTFVTADGTVNATPLSTTPTLILGDLYVCKVSGVREPVPFHVRLPFKDRPLSSFDAVEESNGVFITILRLTNALAMMATIDPMLRKKNDGGDDGGDNMEYNGYSGSYHDGSFSII